MALEIQNLLVASADRARMEAELNTAALVQENLFPAKPDLTLRDLELSGLYEATSECSGDWWYYFKKGNEVFVVVADATGHGTPAALITTAIRAIFSVVEKQDLSLSQIASLCDEAIYSCSKSNINMTALLLRIDTVSGDVRMINASHEAPVFLTLSEAGLLKASFFVMEPDPPFGRLSGQWHEHRHHLKPQEMMILFTDGISASIDAKGNPLSERKLIRKIEELAQNKLGVRTLIEQLKEFSIAHGEGHDLKDDITIVGVRRTEATV